jgi:hypothetical protein
MHAVPNRSLLVLVAVLLVPLFVLPASAQKQEQEPEQKQEQNQEQEQEQQQKKKQRSLSFPPGLAEARLVKEMAKEIGVGEETLEKLEALVTETRAKDQELAAQLKEENNKVLVLLREGRPNEKAVLETSALGAKVFQDIRVLKLQVTLKVRALLNEEQLAKFMEIREKAASGRGGRRKRGGPPRR